MSFGATAFVSSTVLDLADVRDKVRESLTRLGFNVLLSERPDYPVEPGVTSHDACLAGVRQANVFILLIGGRFGGAYKDQEKSITWREWEEARATGLNPIVLIKKETNDLALQLSKERAKLKTANPSLRLSEQNEELAKRPEFADRKPDIHRLPSVQRFIDCVRKGHVDNWVHLDWDGTAEGAMSLITPRLSASFASYQRSHQRMAERARRQYLSVNALSEIAKVQAELLRRRRDRGLSGTEAAEALLKIIEANHADLLGFKDGDLHNFAIHFREDDTMVPGLLRRHATIPVQGRNWPSGRGHIGLALRDNVMLVAGDLHETDGWVQIEESEASDRHCYSSAVTVPLYLKGDPKRLDATFTVTSSRPHHFEDLDQLECLTAAILGNILGAVLG